MSYQNIGQDLRTTASPTFANLAVTTINSLDLANAIKSHGFVNQTGSAIAMNGSNFEITVVSGSYDILVNGVKTTISTTKSVAISNDLTLHYVTLNSAGTIEVATSAWSILDLTKIPVATVYKDGSTYIIGDERHGYLRDLPWHNWAHNTIGTRYKSGGTGTFTGTTLSITQSVISDEDIDLDTGGTLTTANIWYRNAGLTAMRVETGSATPYRKEAITNKIMWDNAGTLTAGTNNKYYNSWVYASNDKKISIVVGQNEWNTLTAARDAAVPTFLALSTVEWKLLYRVTFQATAAAPTYIETTDYRNVSNAPAGTFTPTSHAGLTDRSTPNQHPNTAVSPTIITGVDAKTVAQTTLFTVPTGYVANVYSLAVVVQAASAITVPPSIQLGTTGSPSSMVAAVALDAGMTTAGKVQRFTFQSDELAAGTVIEFGITAAATGTSMTVKATLQLEVY
jgi:hypothetical protein